jgi:hypothetical protein
MRVTFDIDTKAEFETLTFLLRSLDLKDINIVPVNKSILPTITKGDKKLKVSSLFGVWKSNPQTLENIRRKGWFRNNPKG